MKLKQSLGNLLGVAVVAALLASPHRALAQCCGDCNRDGEVRIDELVGAVGRAISGCVVAPRFVGFRDGTVSDRQTGLLWERKTDDGTIHDKDNLYTWSDSGTAPDGTAFTTFLAELNNGTSSDGTSISGCFAGHCDWRLPTSVELKAIAGVDAPGCGAAGPCLAAVFGPTEVDTYEWSSIAYGQPTGPPQVLVLWIKDGSIRFFLKSTTVRVRAVRGGA